LAKIVLNGCYGGFHWSNRAIVEILKRKGVLDKTTFVRTKWGEAPTEISESEYVEGERYSMYHVNDESWEGFDLRDDPDAIAVLEEKGSNFCSGSCSELYIEEYDEELFIPKIEEYDGSETLDLIPNLTEEKVRNCNTIDEVVELLRKTGALCHRFCA